MFLLMKPSVLLALRSCCVHGYSSLGPLKWLYRGIWHHLLFQELDHEGCTETEVVSLTL